MAPLNRQTLAAAAAAAIRHGPNRVNGHHRGRTRGERDGRGQMA
jgi:hypothetical protein